LNQARKHWDERLGRWRSEMDTQSDGGPAVVVNVWGRLSVERWIFTAAHELGHLMIVEAAATRGRLSFEDRLCRPAPCKNPQP
jgi:hypothetical protein